MAEKADPDRKELLGNFPQGIFARRADQRGVAPRAVDQGGAVMTGRLQDKVALITGSDSGIGQDTAIEFAREGAAVAVHYLDDAEGPKKIRAAVEAEGRRAVVAQADISDEQQVHALFEAAVQAFGRVDVLMNNAGVDGSGKDVANLDAQTGTRRSGPTSTARSSAAGATRSCARPATPRAGRSSTSPRSPAG